jgi:hypothetical protein
MTVDIDATVKTLWEKVKALEEKAQLLEFRVGLLEQECEGRDGFPRWAGADVSPNDPFSDDPLVAEVAA